MSKAVIQPFEEYQKARTMFVQTVAELANRTKHIDSLKSVGVMNLLGPLLSDPVKSIKQSAALAIGRLAKHNKELANSVIDDDGRIIKLLLAPGENNNKFYKKATCFVISSVARHSSKFAYELERHHAIDFLVECLEEYDPSVKEAAAWALGYIAKHDEKLALSVAKKATEYLILCLQEPEINIKRITVQTLSHIAKHNRELTDTINNKENNLNYILYFLVLKDITLRYKICTCLANMARNSELVAQKIISSLQYEQILDCIKSPDPSVQKSIITLLNEIASQGDYASSVNDKVHADVVINFLTENRGSARIYGIPLISTMCKNKQEIAKKYVEGGVLGPLNECIVKILVRLDRKKDAKKENIKKEFDDGENHTENDMKATLACKAIGDLSKHSHEITNTIADHENLPYSLLTLAITKELPEELKRSAQDALLEIIENGDQLRPLNTLLNFTFNPHDMKLPIEANNYNDILGKLIRKQKDLLNGSVNKSEKKNFLQSGALEKILKLKKQFPKIKDQIPEFENIYSPEIVNFYNEEYAEQLKQAFLSKS